ncbi:radical SAM protein [Arcicella sp. BE51]|uniref:radical SAM protein n=2 Tax=Arcicella TaxID=217140 RepID=UPI00286D28C9|nr:radical SAM protein [Arcicella sp. BE51]
MRDKSICKVLIMRVASRCNLNCTYCYMYNVGDESFKSQPKFMSIDTVDKVIEQVGLHCETNDLKTFEFIFHGGEPMLISKEFYKYFVAQAKEKLPIQTKLFFAIQTNGILLSEEWCKVFSELKIEIGISIDGYEESHDKYRINHSGNGSFHSVMQGFKVASESAYLHKIPGVLSVINIQSDAEKFFYFLKEYKVQLIDFLLPDCSYEKLPLGYADGINDRTLYADWLIILFDLWFSDNTNGPQIIFFEQLVKIIIGIDEGFEYIGNRKAEFLTIETDGSIEVTGSFKVCGDGFTKKGYNIHTHTLEESLEDDLAQRYINGHDNLCSKCQACPIVEVCGGGFVAHRYSKHNGFDNPSVYCLDLMKLITHVQNKVLDYLPIEFVEESELTYLSFEELKYNNI